MGMEAYKETSTYKGALRILRTLQAAHYEAYIVGGARYTDGTDSSRL